MYNNYRYETMAWFSPFIYAPFYLFVMYAFVLEREWIRVPGTKKKKKTDHNFFLPLL